MCKSSVTAARLLALFLKTNYITSKSIYKDLLDEHLGNPNIQVHVCYISMSREYNQNQEVIIRITLPGYMPMSQVQHKVAALGTRDKASGVYILPEKLSSKLLKITISNIE